jgi:hypothetical protein
LALFASTARRSTVATVSIRVLEVTWWTALSSTERVLRQGTATAGVGVVFHALTSLALLTCSTRVAARSAIGGGGLEETWSLARTSAVDLGTLAVVHAQTTRALLASCARIATGSTVGF